MASARALRSRTVSELVDAVKSGDRPKYVYFWSHRARVPGTIDAACLSQWWPARFEADGQRFGSAEHYMMWRKARLFNDSEIEDKVLAARSPAQAKALGREVRGFVEEQWIDARWEIVVAASIAKFRSDDHLSRYLRATGNRVLLEASPRDRIWGVGLSADSPAISDPARWRGENLLGFALMEARGSL